jgi:hypothetical protein
MMPFTQPLTRLKKMYVPQTCDYCRSTAVVFLSKNGEITDAFCEHHAAEYYTPVGNVESMED